VGLGDRIFGSLRTTFATPAWLDTLERQCWLDIWRAPIIDAIDEMGIETRRYGPVQVTAVAALPREPMLNLVLNAADHGAASKGHLDEALTWIDSLGIKSRVPFGSRHPEAVGAEEVLNRHGYRRAGSLVRFVRDTSRPAFEEPPGTMIMPLRECTEGFAHVLANGFELNLGSESLFDCLPERKYWRCYWVTDEGELPLGAGAMLLHHEIAQLVFAAVREEDLGKGGHMALIRQRILDAAAARCQLIFADTREGRPGDPEPSLAACNLVRAGFKQLSVRQVWEQP
jgi:hypothetical protein